MKRVAYISACVLAGTVALAAGWVRDGWRENVRPSGWRVSGCIDRDGFTRWVADGCRVVRAPPCVSGPVLVAWYELEDAAANQFVVDASGLGHPAATFSGLTAELTVGGVVGNGLRFGGDDRLVASDPAVGAALSSDAWTVAFWLRRDTATYHAETLAFVNASGDAIGLAYHNYDYGVVVVAYPGLGSAMSISSPYAAGTWVHAAFVRDGGALRVYFGGVLVETGALTLPAVAVAELRVGGISSPYADTRSVDDVRVYAGALTNAGVGELFAGYPPAPPPLPPPVYVCTFDCNGGFLTEGESYSKEVTPGLTYGTLPWPGKEGYTFGGWYSYDLSDYVYDWSTVTLVFDHTVVAVWY